jgi:aspartyl protease family protein
MAQGPWEPKPAEPPPPRDPDDRRLIWLVLALGLGGLVWGLIRAFPGAVQGGADWMSIVTTCGLAVLVGAGMIRRGRGSLGKHLKYAAIWVAVFAVLALGVAYRPELAGAGRRLQLAFGGGRPVTMQDRSLAIPLDGQGAFMVIGKVNGRPVRFLVDTGATDTVLSPADARRVGIPVDRLSYTDAAETANGVGYSAPYAVDALEVGPIRLDGFGLSVNQAPMSASLLGRSFLSRLESFEVRGETLTLRWKGEPTSD